MVDTSRVSVESAPQAENDGYDRREAEQAWLSAGRNSDVVRMKTLLDAYPRWLALDRIVDDGDAAAQGPHSPQSKISDWRSFGLDTVGASALHAATWEGNAQIVRFLLDEGLDPDTRDDWQMTPLMVVIMRHTLPMIRSVFRGRVAIPRNLAVDCRQEDAERMQSTLPLLELFLAAGSDLEATNSDGKTALMLAANDDSFEIARLLLEYTIEIDAQDHKGCSALRHSIEARSLLTMNLLLEHRADIDLPDLNGETPLSVVISRGLVNQLQLLLNHHALVSTASRHNFAGAVLMESVEQDAIDVMQFLLENEYVSVEYQNGGGESVLHRVQNVQTLELFTRFDVNWTAFRLRTTTGDSCLHCAARLGSHQVLMAFLDQHERMRSDLADPFTDNLLMATNAVGATALFQAATNASEELEVRNAKSDLLLAFNASLFPVDEMPWRAHDRDPSVQFFTTPVRTCLRLWLQESDDGEAVSDLMSLSAEWICCACFSASRSQLLSSQLVGLVAFTGFACDVVPLLVELPLDRSSVSRFLLALGTFAERQDHRLLRHLHMLLAN